MDGDYLRLEGLYVQELFGGCICCTLSTGLIETLAKVEQLYQPDLVILEATGVARPGDIIKNVRKYRSEATEIQVITLVDATRYEMLMKMLVPLITSQIQAAGIVAINKIDQVEQEAVALIILEVSRLNTQANVIAISADKQINMDLITTYLL